MNRVILAAPLLALLVGCSSAPAAVEPTPSASANEAACSEFEQASVALLNTIANDDGTINDWDAELDNLDTVGLSAEGQVQDRILAIVSDGPKPSDLYIYEEAREELNDMISSVERACAADGFEITANKFVTN